MSITFYRTYRCVEDGWHNLVKKSTTNDTRSSSNLLSLCGSLCHQQAATLATLPSSFLQPPPRPSSWHLLLFFTYWQPSHLGPSNDARRACQRRPRPSPWWRPPTNMAPDTKCIRTDKEKVIYTRPTCLPPSAERFINPPDDDTSKLETSPHHHNERGRRSTAHAPRTKRGRRPR